jgi:hypothetical protein
LNRLPVLPEDVDANDGALPLRVGRLDDIVVEVLLPSELVETLENELEEGLEVLRTRRGDEDVGVRVKDSEGDGETEGGGFTTSTGSGEGDGLGEGLGGDSVGEGEDRLRLVEGASLSDNISDALRVGHALLKRVQLRLAFLLATLALARGTGESNTHVRIKRNDVLSGGDGENVELVVDDKAGRVVAEGKEETLVEAGDGGGVGGGGAVAGVNVLRRREGELRKKIVIGRKERNAPWSCCTDP